MTALLGSEKPLNGKRSPWILMVKNYDVFHPNLITSKHSQIKYQSRHEDELIWVIKDTRILKVCQLLQKKICWDFDRDCIRSIDQRAPRRNDPAGPHEPRLASDSKSPAVRSGPRQRAITPAVQCAPPHGGTRSGEESPSSWDMGRSRKGGRHALPLCGEPGSKPLVDDLLLVPALCSCRAAPSLRSSESQPLAWGFVEKERRKKQKQSKTSRIRRLKKKNKNKWKNIRSMWGNIISIGSPNPWT